MNTILNNQHTDKARQIKWTKFVLLAWAFCFCLTSTMQAQVLFSDDFTRTNDPAPITPWLIPSATSGAVWSITGGTMQSGNDPVQNYAFTYVTNSSSNYSVQAQLKFSNTNGWGGGVGGYLNTASGAHYAAWLYPENSAGGGNAIRLIKFSNWTTFGYQGTNFAFMAVTNLASLGGVGTTQHTLKMSFLTNQITIFYDGVQVISTTDAEVTPYTSGAVSMDMWMDVAPYTLNFDNFQLSAISIAPVAAADNYSVVQNATLTVPAPGVLANDSGGLGTLTAAKITNPLHGSVTLSSNGGFVYNPTGGYTGSDTFTYQANDGHTNSASATVTISVTADHPPVANGESYTLVANSTFNVAAPGILANDTDADNDSLTAVLVTGPTNGLLSLTNNGGFAYTPTNNFSGIDTFTYKANDGISNSTAAATVTLSVLPTSTLFYDSFVRATDPGPLTPWVAQSGNWSVTGNKLFSGINTMQTYAFAYLTNVWTNYSVQGQIQFSSTGGWGGGIGGRLNSGTGAHYGAWVYPESSAGGGNALRLIKFSNYGTFSYLGTNFGFMAETNLATLGGVGTNVHTLKLTFLGNQISVFYDGTQVVKVTDTEASPYTTGGITADMWTDIVTYNYSLSNVVVSALANDDSYRVNSGATLNVAAPGVLGNDSDVFSSGLTATQVAAPANGSLTLNANGSFTYIPNGGFSGADSFTYRANDGATNLGVATVYINVINVGPAQLIFSENFDSVTAPALPSGWTTTSGGTQTAWVTQTNARDSLPNSAFSIDSANIGSNALISPVIPIPAGGDTQLTFRNNYAFETGGGTNGFDGGMLEIKVGSGAFTDIQAAGGVFINGGYNQIINNTFFNPYSGRPAWSGSSGGFITTTVNLPPGVAGNNIQLRWITGTDNGNGSNGWRIDTISITNCTSFGCWNTSPILAAQLNRTNNELIQLVVTNTATDADIPAQTLTYSLLTAPTNAAISASGVITWTPLQTQSPSTNTFTTRVVDNGSGNLSATNTFTVVVKEVNIAPLFPVQNTITNFGTAPLVVTNAVTEPNIHATTTGYTLVSPPSGMTISTNGIISWTPLVAQVPSTNLITTIATNLDSFDLTNPKLTATNTFTVVVSTVHNGPTLPVQTARTNNELVTLTVTNTASDIDIPVLALTYVLTNGSPAGATISSNGIITWNPTQNQSPSTNTITTVVTDNGAPAKSSTNSFTVVVKEINVAPTFPSPGSQIVNELALLTVTNAATESNIHSTNSGYTLVSPLAGMNIDSNGVFTWTPAQTQSPSTNIVTTIVTNRNPFDTLNTNLTATNTFQVIVREINVAPTLPSIGTVTVNELVPLTVTNTATETNIHAVITGYGLISPLTGMNISSNGIFTWTPQQNQSPSTNLVTVVVTNSDVLDTVNPTLTATNTFTVVVKEVNVAPILASLSSQTINELVPFSITNSATEPNVHAVTTGFGLVSAQAGMNIDSNGVFTWTPSQSQSPSTNTITVVVTNSDVFDTVNPVLTATNSFTIVVKEVNVAPVLASLGTQTINELVPFAITNSATEPNTHAVTTGYTLVGPQLGMNINSNGVFTWTPAQTQSPSTNLVTIVVTNSEVFDTVNPVLTATNSFTVIVKEVNVAPVLAAISTQTINSQVPFTITNAVTEPNIHAVTTGFSLIAPQVGMNIDSNGVFTWTPQVNQTPSTNLVTVVVTNNDVFDTVNPVLTATNSFTIVVKEVNIAPVFATIGTQTINEQVPFAITNAVTEPNSHAVTTGFGLISPLLGMNIDSNGVFTWTPSQSQSPSTNTVTVVVTNNDAFDAINPVLTATNSFTIIVKEVNVAPILAAAGPQTVNELVPLIVTNIATEPNIHAVTTGFGLIAPLAGMTINSNGIFTWTPAQTQSPGTNIVTVVVTNKNAFDTVNPILTATNTFTVVVKEINVAPVLPTIGTVTFPAQVASAVTNTATEPNIHAVTTGYALIAPLTGMAIDTNGIFTWTPDITQSLSTNTVTVVVTNNDAFDLVNPVLTATNSFTVIVKEQNVPPVFAAISTQTVNELVPLTVTNVVSEPNPHAVTTGFGLIAPLAGMNIDSNGVFTWTPAQAQSPSTNTITVVATNSDSFDTLNPVLTATNTFTVIVKEVNVAPILAAAGPQTVNELVPLLVTNIATEPNIHASTTGFGLIAPLAGMAISSNGVFSWTPSQTQSPSTNLVTVVVTNKDVFDAVNPVLTATNSFTVIVKEVNVAPTLAAIGTQIVNELVQLTVTNIVTETNIHATTAGFGLIAPLAGMTISSNGVFTWTPTQIQSPGTNTVTVVVTNSDVFDTVNPTLTATNTFTVIVKEVNVAPILAAIGTKTVNELVPLLVTNIATEPNIHATTTGFGLISPLAGMTITSGGVFSWTPTQAQSPSTNTVTVVVTNSDAFDTVNPTLTATNTFTVIVKEVNVAPILAAVGTQTVNELVSLLVTNIATEPNVHATTTGYGLISPLAGMTITSGGVFSWTPSQAQSPSTNTVTVVVTNSDAFDTVNPTLTATNTFTVIVKEVNVAPILAAVGTQTVNDLVTLLVTNIATEPNIHATTTGFGLVAPLTGMTITSGGVFSWTPSQTQSPSTNTVTVVVTNSDVFDTVNPSLTATNTFTVIVKDVNVAPTLPVIDTKTVVAQTLLTVTNTASESHLNSKIVGYGLVGAPSGAVISTNGIFTWTPTTAGTNTITTVVTNNDPYDAVNPNLTATNSFTVIVTPLATNTPPTLSPITISNGVVTLTWSSVVGRTYRVQYKSSLATTNWSSLFPDVTATGAVSSTTDTLGSTKQKFYRVILLPTGTVNTAPVLPSQSTRNVTVNTALTVTNTATDSDVPVNVLTYQLVTPPAGVVISTNGIITWTPTVIGTNTITTVVYDDGIPAKSATNSFQVITVVAAPAPSIQSVAKNGTNVVVTWSAVSSRSYRIQYNTSLTTTNWTDITPDVLASGTTASSTNSTGAAAQRFYRVRLLP